jgi:hypothetical protein
MNSFLLWIGGVLIGIGIGIYIERAFWKDKNGDENDL